MPYRPPSWSGDRQPVAEAWTPGWATASATQTATTKVTSEMPRDIDLAASAVNPSASLRERAANDRPPAGGDERSRARPGQSWNSVHEWNKMDKLNNRERGKEREYEFGEFERRILGAGRMATALAGGFVREDLVPVGRIAASDPSEPARARFEHAVPGTRICVENTEVPVAAMLFSWR